MSFLVHNRLRWAVPGVLCVYGIVLIFFADTRIEPGLDSDRYAFMESLVERGRCTVDDASLVSVDRIRIGEHYYSGKPPLLNFAGAGVYWVLHTLFGWSFHGRPQAVVRVMIAVFVVVPVCVLLWMFWVLCSRGVLRTTGSGPIEKPDGSRREATAILAVVLLAVGSLLLPFSLIFTNHPLAAALLLGSFCLAVEGPSDTATTTSRARPFLVAFLGALSAAVDLIPAGVFLLVYFCWQLTARRARTLLACLLGLAIPLVTHLVLNRLTLGTWMLSYLIKGAFDYEGSVWNASFTGSSDYDQFPTYFSALYHYTLGHRGVFVFMPLLLAGLWFAARAIRSHEAPRRFGATAAIAVFAGTILLVPAFSMGLGGCAYGPRHIVPCVALVYAFLPSAIASLRTLFHKSIFTIGVLWSVMIAGLGLLDPWAPQVYSVYAPLDVIVPRLALMGGDGRAAAEYVIDRTAASPSFGYYNLGQYCGRNHKPDLAIHYLMKSTSIDDTRTLALYQLGILAGASGKSDLSLKAFRRLLELEPDNAGARATMGTTLLQAGRLDEARRAFEKALSLNPASFTALKGLARFYELTGNTQKAAEYRERLPKD